MRECPSYAIVSLRVVSFMWPYIFVIFLFPFPVLFSFFLSFPFLFFSFLFLFFSFSFFPFTSLCCGCFGLLRLRVLKTCIFIIIGCVFSGIWVSADHWLPEDALLGRMELK